MLRHALGVERINHESTCARRHSNIIRLTAERRWLIRSNENDNDNVIVINSIFVPLSLALGSNREIGRSHVVIQTTRTSNIVVHWRCVRFFVIACITDSRQTRQPTDY